MDPARWAKVKEVFVAARSAETAGRAELVADLAHGDDEVRAEAMALLCQADELDESFLAGPFDPGSPPNVFRPGDMIAGRYRIESFLAAGGMGEVYAAEDTLLRLRIAIKTIHSSIIGDENSRRRFRQEIQTARRIAHPNVCRVFDMGVHGAGPGQRLFLTMELLAGETLAARLRRGLRFTLAEARPLIHQMADALQAAHDVNVIHRDFKPGNIFLARGSTGLRTVVTDFGLARDVSPEAASTESITKSIVEGRLMGTPAYMSPELLQGARASVPSDLYALGVVMFEMAAGRRPYTGETPFAEALQKINGQPPAPSLLAPGVDPDWERLILRCLDPDPARRPASARAVAGVLSAAPAVASPAPQRARGLRLVAAGAAALALAAIAVLGWSAWRKPLPAPAPMKVAALTSMPGIEEHASFSPDGSQIAYVHWPPGANHSHIYLAMVDEGSGHQLTTGPDADDAPAFSPDGRYLAFIRRPPNRFIQDHRRCLDGSVYVVAPLGGAERLVVTGQIRSVGWTSSADLLYSECKQSGRDGDLSYYSVIQLSMTSKESHRLTDPPLGTRGDSHFAVSPDGQTLALTRWLSSSATDIVLRPLTPGGRERVLHREQSLTTTIAWSPDGRELIYASGKDGLARLVRLPIDRPGDGPTPIAGIESRVGGAVIHPGGGGRPARMIFHRQTTNPDVWLYDLATGAGRAVLASMRRDSSAQFSPDGRRIVFSSERRDSHDIWVSDAEGGNPEVVVKAMARSGAPSWSPDGRWIAFDSSATGSRKLWLADASGGGRRQLTFENQSAEARSSFSADGQSVFHRSDRANGKREIWRVPVAGGPSVQVTYGGGEEPRASPDGRWVYYIRQRMHPGVWRVPVAGGPETLVCPKASFGYWDVTPHGIYYLDLAVPGPERPIMFHDFATGVARKLVNVRKEIDLETPGFSVTRDGSRALVLQLETQEGDLHMVDHFK